MSSGSIEGGCTALKTKENSDGQADDQTDRQRWDHPTVTTRAVIVVRVGGVVTSSHRTSFAHHGHPMPPGGSAPRNGTDEGGRREVNPLNRERLRYAYSKEAAHPPLGSRPGLALYPDGRGIGAEVLDTQHLW